MNLPPHAPARVVATDGFFDPDCSNGMRAESARAAVEYYQNSRGMDEDAVLNTTDLITDLLHYLHSLGDDPLMVLQKAGEYFEREAGVSAESF